MQREENAADRPKQSLQGQEAQQSDHMDSEDSPVKKGKSDKVQTDLQYEETETPQHFYDSDVASVRQKDFLSDNEPPKDIAQERKLLYKEKMLHVYKTIISLGYGIDKPARYDKIKLRCKQLQTSQPKKQITLNCEQAQKILENQQLLDYNIGVQNEDIERLVTSTRPQQIALFQLEQLETSSKNSVKTLKQRTSYLIGVTQWTTVIDLDGDKQYLKYVLEKGNGPHRVSQHDEVSFKYTMRHRGHVIQKQFEKTRMETQIIQAIPKLIWKMLNSMKKSQRSQITIKQEAFQALQGSQHYQKLVNSQDLGDNTETESQEDWKIQVQVADLHKIDDVDLDGKLLKKTIVRGISTAKPDASSVIYFALGFMGPDGQILKQDTCFKSDWWEDYVKLDSIGCRKVFLDEYRVSKMLKRVFYRMKPAEVAEVECRDPGLFTFGQDYDQMKQLYASKGMELPKSIHIMVRVYNFTEGRTCFNMELDEKVQESKRKKLIALKFFEQKNYSKALRRFQNIVSFYSEGKINQEGYNQKVSALMNSILCQLKMNEYKQMIPLCNEVLKKPQHGADIQDITIHGPQNVKIQNKREQKKPPSPIGQPSQEGQQPKAKKIYSYVDKKQDQGPDVEVNQKIINKCLYRKALALNKTGQYEEALQCLQKITEQTEDSVSLKKQIDKNILEYVKKSKQIFKNMFAAFK